MTTSKLPARPSLDSLRKQAKKLARDTARGDAAAIARARAQLPRAELPLLQRDAQLVLEFVRTGLVTPAFVLGDHLPRLSELARRYHDRRPDLADICLIRMSELNPKHLVVTTDLTDFRVYRRNRRESIPLLLPPARP